MIDSRADIRKVSLLMENAGLKGEASLELYVYVVLTDLRALRSLAQLSSPVQSKASLSSVSEAHLLLFCVANFGWIRFFEVNLSQICSSQVPLGGGSLLDYGTRVYVSAFYSQIFLC